jgi:cardiolipin synthase
VLFDERRRGALRHPVSFIKTRFRRLPFIPARRIPAEGPQPEHAYLCRPDVAVIPGNAVELLCGGEEVLPAMLDAIGRARRSVDVEMYTFASDSVGRRFARALAERAQEGIRVRVLVDAAGCRQTPRSFFGWMRERGVRVQGVNPIRKFLLHGPLFRWRDHRKLVVVDDDAAFVGGLNLSRDYAPVREGGCGWRDAAVRVRGPVVDALSASFEKFWRDGARATPPPDPACSPPAGDVPSMLLESRPVGPGPFAAVFRHAVNQARRRIWIANPYFLPPRSFRKALRRAARRGVDVRLLLPRRSDSPIALRASQRSYANYLRSGIRLFEWPGAMMHSKAAVIDGLWSTIGSYNIDPLSLLINRELNVVLLGASTGNTFEGMFEKDFACAEEIDAEGWKVRGAWRRFTENLCASFRILL